MYLPNLRDSLLNLPVVENEPLPRIQAICANREKKLIAVAANNILYIWLANPQLLLCSVGVSDDTWKENKGEFQRIYWRPDSSAIAVTTNRSQMFIYSVHIQTDESCYNFVDSNDPYFQRNSHELFLKGNRPIVTIRPTIIINLAEVPSSCVPSREEMIVCVKNGFTHHVTWNGMINAEMSFRLSNVPFSHDQLQSKPEFVTSTSTHISDITYAPLIGGFCVVLSDGQGALLTSTDPTFAPKSILGVWATNLKDAVCCDVNHKFLYLLFGCKNGDVCAYNVDELSGALVQSFRVAPKVTNGPDFTNRLGPVLNLCVISNGYGFAAVWKSKETEGGEKGRMSPLPRMYSIFTPFGAQTFCSLEGVIEDSSEDCGEVYTCIEWGPDGYQLWLGTNNSLRVQPIVRSASCGNPFMEHIDRAVLMSDSHVFIGAAEDKEADACAPHSVWDYISVPHEYLSSNWPLRYASVDRNYRHLTVAGERGFAYCSLIHRRWKIFGNESQEKNFLVTGGMFVWEDAVLGAVGTNLDSDKPVLALYPTSQRLDTKYASIIDLEASATMVALRGDVVGVFDIAAEITLYRLSAQLNGGRDSYPKISADIVSVIRINELIPHPACVVSLQMTTLNLDVRGKPSPVFHSNIDTILVNIAGRLITLCVYGEDGKLSQPMVIASFVEKIWHDRSVSPSVFKVEANDQIKGHRKTPSNLSTPSSSTSDSPATPHKSMSVHLSNALWLACGAKGIRVWLPLIPGRRSTSTQEMTFIAKRIMLPFDLDIYPLVICARDCLAMGVESQSQIVAKCSKSQGKSENVSIYGLHRNSEVFVHHLLRQLLKRNLGVFALEVAASCRSLPHFAHALELLLHGVLEEEATSSEPIPDPLLPRCVAFIHEFPEFLKTVAHCARKTELALWPALFDVTGSPNALFEKCLEQGELENAASFVIVLQNFESTETSMEQAARLVRSALDAGKWSIVREMVRFARSIGAEDIDMVTPPPSAKTSLSRRPTVSSPEQSNEFVINRFQAGGAGRLAKVRHSQNDKEIMSRKDSTGSTAKAGLTRAISGEVSPQPTSNRLAARMNKILEEHFWHLLNNYLIKDLGFFWSELQFDICGFLETRRSRLQHPSKNPNDECCLIEDFPLALTRLHSQFSWPFPMIGSQFVHQIEKKLGNLKMSQSTASLNGFVEMELSESFKPTSSEKTICVDKSAILERQASSDDGELEIQEASLQRVVGSQIDLPMHDRHSVSSLSANIPPTTPSSSETRSIAGDWQNTDYLVGEKSSRGNTESSRQIEFMLNLFAQTGAIDWVFVLCLIGRDDRRLRQEINAAVIRKVGERAFLRIRFACSELARWAVEKCCGYVALLQLFDAHLAVVAEQLGIPEKKYTPPSDYEAKSEKGSRSRQNRVNSNVKLNSTFAQRRERSRSSDRAHPAVKRYDEVVCAEDAIEKMDEEGCLVM
ncbi:unnamed protein product [Caenorhabditis bovis]|uniref:Protein RIC1 homolog n=1 Tax=Caenorhabditis bovis TaxID=2654633 RepID=A0A8S1FG88_9PELO|nr:unnamed protein product [Caenorhabditis bovis]